MQPVMIEVAGAERLATPGSPQPLWFKTKMTRDGPFLKATTYLVVHGNPKVFHTKIDLRPIARTVASRAVTAGIETNEEEVMVGAIEYDDAIEIGRKKRKSRRSKRRSARKSRRSTRKTARRSKRVTRRVAKGKSPTRRKAKGGVFGVKFKFNPLRRRDPKKRTGGFFGRKKGLGSIVHKVGRTKLVRKINSVMKSVGRTAAKVGKAIIKSPITKGIVAAAAVIYPPVGVPAAAALAAANVALAAIEGAKKVGNGIRDAVRKKSKGMRVSKALAKMGSTRARTALRKSPRALKALRDGKKAAILLSRARSPRGMLQLKGLGQAAEEARARFKSIAMAAKFSKNPVQRDHARRLARVVRIAAEARAKVKGAVEKNVGGLAGLFIDSQGKLVKGNFRRVLKKAPGTDTGFVYRQKGVQRGRFKRVSSMRAVAKSHVSLIQRSRTAERNKIAAEARYRAAKAEAFHNARLYKGRRIAAAKGNQSDKVLAVRSMRDAKSRGMSRSNRLKLAKGLGFLMGKKRRGRSNVMAASRLNVATSARKMRNTARDFGKATRTFGKIANTAKKVWGGVSALFAGEGEMREYENVVGCECASRVGYENTCIRIAGAPHRGY